MTVLDRLVGERGTTPAFTRCDNGSELVLGMLAGILTAVFLSLALVIARISRPRTAVIGATDEGDAFHELPRDHWCSTSRPSCSSR